MSLLTQNKWVIMLYMIWVIAKYYAMGLCSTSQICTHKASPRHIMPLLITWIGCRRVDSWYLAWLPRGNWSVVPTPTFTFSQPSAFPLWRTATSIEGTLFSSGASRFHFTLGSTITAKSAMLQQATKDLVQFTVKWSSPVKLKLTGDADIAYIDIIHFVICDDDDATSI